MSWYAQSEYEIKFEWGMDGLLALKDFSDVIVIIDALSFTTATCIACEAGALVYPFALKDERAEEFAKSVGAILAQKRSRSGLSLSPNSLRALTIGQKIVLPSLNGSHLSTSTADLPTIAACFRNASAAAKLAQKMGQRITVIAAGERWRSDEMRPALEDHLAAGAVIAALAGNKSPEAQGAEDLLCASKARLASILQTCASGKELIEAGFREDVEIASEVDVSQVVPILSHEQIRYYRQ